MYFFDYRVTINDTNCEIKAIRNRKLGICTFQKNNINNKRDSFTCSHYTIDQTSLVHTTQ